MTDSTARSRARSYFYLLTILFLIAQVLFFTEVEVVSTGDILGGILFTCVFLIFIGLTIKGYNWAKWVLTVLLALFGVMFLYAGFDIPSQNLKIVGLYYLLFGLVPHFSQRLKPITIRKIKETISDSSKTESVPLTVNNKPAQFPYLIDRYKALLIDGLLMLTLLTICLLINAQLELSSTWIIVVYSIMVLFYEPILIAHSSTIGQKVMKIRVRSINNPTQRINIGQAYVRFFIKALLGWLSFVTISFNPEKRAIHDMAASSVVIRLQRNL